MMYRNGGDPPGRREPEPRPPEDEPLSGLADAAGELPAYGNGSAAEIAAAPDATLGGYFREHDRPPAFEGIDGQPYSVSIEVERTGDLVAPYIAYLVFPRWAYTGLGIVGHVESAVILRARTQDEARRAAEALTLYETKRLLDDAILRKARDLEGASEEGPSEE